MKRVVFLHLGNVENLIFYLVKWLNKYILIYLDRPNRQVEGVPLRLVDFTTFYTNNR